jgi:hypothetical protein
VSRGFLPTILKYLLKLSQYLSVGLLQELESTQRALMIR